MSRSKILLSSSILILCVSFVIGDCQINLPERLQNRPRPFKQFGSLRLPMPYENTLLVLRDEEQLHLYCQNEFKNSEHYGDSYENFQNEKEKTIWCRQGSLMYNNHYNYPEISCQDIENSVYELIENLPWCEVGTKSYATVFHKDKVVATFCVQVETMEVRNFLYIVGPHIRTHDHNDMFFPHIEVNASLGLKIENWNILPNPMINLLSVIPNDYWVKRSDFTVYSLVQLSHYDFKFDNIKIYWWDNLKYGNWKRFTSALQKQAHKKEYSIFTGRSGVVQQPEATRTNCTKPKEWIENINGRNISVPEYIWSYVRASDESESFVMVGYNSPFFEFYDEREIIFCEDICDTIDWLHDIQQTFRYVVMGVTFCCNATEVRHLGILDGFPTEDTRVNVTYDS